MAGDILLSRSEATLNQQRLGQSGMAFLFNDHGRIVAHPQMSDLIKDFGGGADGLPKIDALNLPALSSAIQSSKKEKHTNHFFSDQAGRTYVAAFHRI